MEQYQHNEISIFYVQEKIEFNIYIYIYKAKVYHIPLSYIIYIAITT